MNNSIKIKLLIAIMVSCSVTGITFLVMSMMNKGTHSLAIALGFIVTGQIASTIALRLKSKENA